MKTFHHAETQKRYFQHLGNSVKQSETGVEGDHRFTSARSRILCAFPLLPAPSPSSRAIPIFPRATSIQSNSLHPALSTPYQAVTASQSQSAPFSILLAPSCPPVVSREPKPCPPSAESGMRRRSPSTDPTPPAMDPPPPAMDPPPGGDSQRRGSGRGGQTRQTSLGLKKPRRSSVAPPPISSSNAPPAMPAAPPPSSVARSGAPGVPTSSPSAATSSILPQPPQGAGWGTMFPNFPSQQGNQQGSNPWYI